MLVPEKIYRRSLYNEDWKPICIFLEIEKIPAMVVNAQHIKNVPGRKTDIKDSEWIANLLKHGLQMGKSMCSQQAQGPATTEWAIMYSSAVRIHAILNTVKDLYVGTKILRALGMKVE